MTDRPFENPFEYPEPVPAATQLAVLPFTAAVAGFLQAGTPDPNLRVTMHRTMAREGRGYLQQLCAYLGPIVGPQRHVGNSST